MCRPRPGIATDPCTASHRLDALQAMQTTSDQTGHGIILTVLTFDDPEAGRDADAFARPSLRSSTLPTLDNTSDGREVAHIRQYGRSAYERS